jgi:phenylpropionate dioxygenase-like ring-hydroxylating dioxygenase large terminal subunit
MHAIQLNLPGDGALKVHLNRSTYFTLPARKPVALEVLTGCAWVTQEGNRDDHFLCKGERFNLPGRGEAIVQAMGESEIAVFPRTAEETAGFVQWIKRFATDLTRADSPVLERCQDSIEAATRCWGTAIARQSATRLGLERTF